MNHRVLAEGFGIGGGAILKPDNLLGFRTFTRERPGTTAEFWIFPGNLNPKAVVNESTWPSYKITPVPNYHFPIIFHSFQWFLNGGPWSMAYQVRHPPLGSQLLGP